MLSDTFQPFCHEITKLKYGQGVDSYRQIIDRVSLAIGTPGTTEFLEKMRFVPGGRILAGAGTTRRVTLINCYVMGTIEDSLAGIFKELERSAFTMQQGGGIGLDFSPIRPEGSWVSTIETDASGPLAFMDTWDAMCRTIMSAGERRGAMMACLRCDHPDILKFIHAKRTPGRLTKFNLSVLVTDKFMLAVEKDRDWPLVHKAPPTRNAPKPDHEDRYLYKTVKARELWDEILKSTYTYAEPGVIFIDKVNQLNNLHYCEVIAATNPCGEQPLPPYGDCCLGAINLARMVDNPFTKSASVNYDVLRATADFGVRFLDRVLDVTNYPLPEQRAEAMAKRRIGLGVMGLANMLQLLGVRYGTLESLSIIDKVFETIKISAYWASTRRAKELHPFPACDYISLSRAPAVTSLPEALRDHIRLHGLRNGVLLTIPPTGTTAIWAGNVSGGLEPVYAHKYTRNVLQADGVTTKPSEVYDWGYLAFCNYFKIDPKHERPELPGYMMTHEGLTVEDHLTVMAAAQKHIDASISKTINCPTDMSYNDFRNVYRRAFDLGCKSCTTYRPNQESGRGAVLEVKTEDMGGGKVKFTVSPTEETVGSDDDGFVIKLSPDEQREIESYPIRTISENGPSAADVSAQAASGTVNTTADTAGQNVGRPYVLPSKTYKIKPGEHAYYITITDRDEKPYELFIITKEAQFDQWCAAIGRMISAIWRRGGDVDFVGDELLQVHSADGGFWDRGRRHASLVAALGDVIKQHTGLKIVSKQFRGGVCPKCQHRGLKHESGCTSCLNCGYSDCG